MSTITFANNINKEIKNIIIVKSYDQNKQQQELTLEGDKILTADLPAASTKELKISSNNDGFFYQLLTSGFDKLLNENKEIIKGVEISKKYLDENNQEINRIKLGDNIIVDITLRSNKDQLLENMVLVDLLPAGFELLPANNINILKVQNNSQIKIWPPIHVDYREDRIIIFGTIPTHEIKYQYKIKAINKGKFSLPAIYCESMYNPQIYYRGVIGNIIVE